MLQTDTCISLTLKDFLKQDQDQREESLARFGKLVAVRKDGHQDYALFNLGGFLVEIQFIGTLKNPVHLLGIISESQLIPYLPQIDLSGLQIPGFHKQSVPKR